MATTIRSRKRTRTAHRAYDPAATREALMHAATDLFATRGFDGASVDEIAAASGVNKALINYHFGGKAGLYSAILRQVFERLSAGLQPIRDSEAPAEERLRAVIREIGSGVAANPQLPPMVLREILSGGEHLDDATLPHFLAIFGTVRAIVEQGMRSGVFRKVNPFATHLGLVGSLMFFFSTENFRRKRIANLPIGAEQPLPAEYLSHIEELMVRGLAAEPRRARTRR